MAKKGEYEYYRNIGDAGVQFSANKPYSDRINAGPLLNSIAAIYTILNNEYGEKTLRILDLGCGTGWSSNMFALSGHETTGVDLAKDAIRVAKQKFKLPNLTYKTVDYDDLRSLGEFDVVVFIDSLHHADDEIKVLKAAKRRLAKGGICIVCEPGKGHSKSPDAIEAIEKYGVNERDMEPKKVVTAARKAGFNKTEVFTHPFYAQKSLYKKYDTKGAKRLVNSRLGRLLSVMYSATLGKRREGLVVLYK